MTLNENSPRKNPPAFLSEVKRFPDPSKNPSKELGPGYYENPPIDSKKYSNPRLFAESHRFESYGSYIDMKKAKYLPGPGAYGPNFEIEQHKSFNK